MEACSLLIIGALGRTLTCRVGALDTPPSFEPPSTTELMPGTVGVPEIMPVTASSKSPAGRLVAVNFVGTLLAWIAYWNGRFTGVTTLSWPEINGATACGVTLRVRAARPVPPSFIASSPRDAVPAVSGVPLNAPLAASSLSHAGRFVAL